jgi:hypothetical protein
MARKPLYYFHKICQYRLVDNVLNDNIPLNAIENDRKTLDTDTASIPRLAF